MSSGRSSYGNGTRNLPKHRVWTFKLWYGGDFFGWVRLLIHNRFAQFIGVCSRGSRSNGTKYAKVSQRIVNIGIV